MSTKGRVRLKTGGYDSRPLVKSVSEAGKETSAANGNIEKRGYDGKPLSQAVVENEPPVNQHDSGSESESASSENETKE